MSVTSVQIFLLSPPFKSGKQASFFPWSHVWEEAWAHEENPPLSPLDIHETIARAFTSSHKMPDEVSQRPKLSTPNDLDFPGSGVKLQDLSIYKVLMILLEILEMEPLSWRMRAFFESGPGGDF